MLNMDLWVIYVSEILLRCNIPQLPFWVQVSVFGYGADEQGNWHHYWEENRYAGAFRKTGVHSAEFETQIIHNLAKEGKIRLHLWHHQWSITAPPGSGTAEWRAYLKSTVAFFFFKGFWTEVLPVYMLHINHHPWMPLKPRMFTYLIYLWTEPWKVNKSFEIIIIQKTICPADYKNLPQKLRSQWGKPPSLLKLKHVFVVFLSVFFF